MKCYNHPDRDAVGVCIKCGKAVCAEDSIVVDGKLYCKDCNKSAETGPVFSSSKRLYKSRKNKLLCGVCGGIADYLNIDPTIIRVLWVLFCLAGGSGVIAYIILCLIVPEEPA